MLFLRDARPVYLSRKALGKIENYFESIENYCTEKSKLKKFYDENPQLHENLHQLKFEDLAENPVVQFRNIYDFLHWDYPGEVEAWIRKNTKESSG